MYSIIPSPRNIKWKKDQGVEQCVYHLGYQNMGGGASTCVFGWIPTKWKDTHKQSSYFRGGGQRVQTASAESLIVTKYPQCSKHVFFFLNHMHELPT